MTLPLPANSGTNTRQMEGRCIGTQNATINKTVLVQGQSNKFLDLSIPYKHLLQKSNLNPLCLYDGIKLRSYNQEYIEWLKSDEQRVLFDIKPTLDAKHEMVLFFKGKYKNIEIKIHYLAAGWAVDFSGSVHKFFNIIATNQKQNYNDFYWQDFLIAYHELVRVFCFNPNEVDVVNLEVGANCLLPQHIQLSVPEIMENILSLFGVCKNKSWILESDRDTFKVSRGERYLKFYDKTIQSKLEKQIVRLELGYERARQIIRDSEATSFYDLTKIATLFSLRQHLIEKF